MAGGLRAHREANVRFERAYRAFLASLPRGESETRSQIDQLLDAADKAQQTLATSMEKQRARSR